MELFKGGFEAYLPPDLIYILLLECYCYALMLTLLCLGQIGMSINAGWIIPKDPESTEDKIAAARGIEFQLGWFGDPVYKVI